MRFCDNAIMRFSGLLHSNKKQEEMICRIIAISHYRNKVRFFGEIQYIKYYIYI